MNDSRPDCISSPPRVVGEVPLRPEGFIRLVRVASPVFRRGGRRGPPRRAPPAPSTTPRGSLEAISSSSTPASSVSSFSISHHGVPEKPRSGVDVAVASSARTWRRWREEQEKMGRPAKTARRKLSEKTKRKRRERRRWWRNTRAGAAVSALAFPPHPSLLHRGVQRTLLRDEEEEEGAAEHPQQEELVLGVRWEEAVCALPRAQAQATSSQHERTPSRKPHRSASQHGKTLRLFYRGSGSFSTRHVSFKLTPTTTFSAANSRSTSYSFPKGYPSCVLAAPRRSALKKKKAESMSGSVKPVEEQEGTTRPSTRFSRTEADTEKEPYLKCRSDPPLDSTPLQRMDSEDCPDALTGTLTMSQHNNSSVSQSLNLSLSSRRLRLTRERLEQEHVTAAHIREACEQTRELMTLNSGDMALAAAGFGFRIVTVPPPSLVDSWSPAGSPSLEPRLWGYGGSSYGECLHASRMCAAADEVQDGEELPEMRGPIAKRGKGDTDGAVRSTSPVNTSQEGLTRTGWSSASSHGGFLRSSSNATATPPAEEEMEMRVEEELPPASTLPLFPHRPGEEVAVEKQKAQPTTRNAAGSPSEKGARRHSLKDGLASSPSPDTGAPPPATGEIQRSDKRVGPPPPPPPPKQQPAQRKTATGTSSVQPSPPTGTASRPASAGTGVTSTAGGGDGVCPFTLWKPLRSLPAEGSSPSTGATVHQKGPLPGSRIEQEDYLSPLGGFSTEQLSSTFAMAAAAGLGAAHLENTHHLGENHSITFSPSLSFPGGEPGSGVMWGCAEGSRQEAMQHFWNSAEGLQQLLMHMESNMQHHGSLVYSPRAHAQDVGVPWPVSAPHTTVEVMVAEMEASGEAAAGPLDGTSEAELLGGGDNDDVAFKRNATAAETKSAVSPHHDQQPGLEAEGTTTTPSSGAAEHYCEEHHNEGVELPAAALACPASPSPGRQARLGIFCGSRVGQERGIRVMTGSPEEGGGRAPDGLGAVVQPPSLVLVSPTSNNRSFSRCSSSQHRGEWSLSLTANTGCGADVPGYSSPSLFFDEHFGSGGGGGAGMAVCHSPTFRGGPLLYWGGMSSGVAPLATTSSSRAGTTTTTTTVIPLMGHSIAQEHEAPSRTGEVCRYDTSLPRDLPLNGTQSNSQYTTTPGLHAVSSLVPVQKGWKSQAEEVST